MFSWNNVQSVHLDLTDRCNAACPMCPRNDHGGAENPNLPNAEMSLESARRIFPAEIVKNLKQIFACGNFGDPIMAKDTLEIFRYFRDCNPDISLGLHSNGSARPPSWWRQMGELLSREGDYCKFGLDGLGDTNHLYRQNTNWDRIMLNAEAFIAGGGKAHWEFLVFAHNEHQIAEARALSEKMGFQCFFPKRTSRFFNYQTGALDPFPVKDKLGTVVRYLHPPSEEKWQNDQAKKISPAPSTAPSSVPEKKKNHVVQYFQRATVDCMAIRDKSIYVSASGVVFPCCFLGGQVNYSDPGEDGFKLRKMLGQFGSTLTNASVSSAIKVVEGQWFSAIADSWEKPSTEQGKIGTCARQCGKEFRPFEGEYLRE
jgi:MoaA/NifB/PqqE/SkfB family radical SAM enzyme